MACPDQIWLVDLASTACPHSFMSGHGERLSDPKSGQDLDPDMPGCTMSYPSGETDPIFF